MSIDEVRYSSCKIPFSLDIEVEIVRRIMDILHRRTVSIGVVSAADDSVFYSDERTFYIYADTYEGSINLSMIRELVGNVKRWRFKAVGMYVTKEEMIGIKLFVSYTLNE